MASLKQVKVDNWGMFFLQRLKHFFNRTDHCDLTLQFRDYAQLKVHRLVLNACTTYFELLERTCEIYDDCLIMPDDLQADVVVPIVNFMYTGQLEYESKLFDRLYSTAQVMNMTVLIKLLDSQKTSGESNSETINRKEMINMNEHLAQKKPIIIPATHEDFNNVESPGRSTSYNQEQREFHKSNAVAENPKKYIVANRKYGPGPGHKQDKPVNIEIDPARPTRYELPEELENEEIFDTAFADISYESIAHSKAIKRKNSNEDFSTNIYDESTSSRKFEELKKVLYKRPKTSPDTSHSKQIDFGQVNEFTYQQKMRSDYINQEGLSDDDNSEPLSIMMQDSNKSTVIKRERADSDISFNSINKYRGTTDRIYNKNSNVSVSHAKIISEVLKKYPHLVKSNKNIKLKIMTAQEKNEGQNYILEPSKSLTPVISSNSLNTTNNDKKSDWIYVQRHENLDAMASLISLGAENTSGPWLCLICGTPKKALKFLTYNAFYRHLVDIHKQRIAPKICEYCGFKSGKRNHLLHHMYTKHDVPPPPHYHFPKCNQCSYIALTEAFLVKHKLSHNDSVRGYPCRICSITFKTRTQLMNHQCVVSRFGSSTPEKRQTAHCSFCDKVFLRPANLYAHMKIAHKDAVRSLSAQNSDDEYDELDFSSNKFEYNQREEHVNIKQEYDGKIHIVSNTQINKPIVKSPQKLLNSTFIGKVRDKIRGYESASKQYLKTDHSRESDQSSKTDNYVTSSRNIDSAVDLVDVVVINENEYILQNEDSTMEQDEIGIETNDEMIIPDILEDHQSQVQQDPISSQIGIIISPDTIVQEEEPVQNVLADNPQYKAIVSSSQIVYNNTSKTNIQNIQLEGSRAENVMVLNEEDFQAACTQSLPNDGSNIVVVYSHPVEPDVTYIDVSDKQLESQEGQTDEHPSILSEHEVVHETVETWHEETVDPHKDEQENSIVIEENQSVDYEVEEVQVEPQEVQLNDDDKCNGNETIHEISNTPTDTSEVDILQESEEHESIINKDCANIPIEEQGKEIVGECIEIKNSTHNYAIQEKNIPPPTYIANEHVEKITTEWSDDACSQKEVEKEDIKVNEDTSTENVDVVDEDQPMDVEETIENIKNEIAKQVDDPEEHEITNIDEVVEVNTSEMNALNEDKAKELIEPMLDAESSVDNEFPIIRSVDSATPDVIEEITEEVCTSVIDVQEEVVNEDVGVTEDVIVADENMEIEINANNEEIVEEEMDVENITSGEYKDDEQQPAPNVKIVEKISHLLNEWEDNDSQLGNDDLEGTTVSQEISIETEGEKKDVTVKESNIEKLVSDWDEEDEK